MIPVLAEAELPLDWYDGASQVLLLFRVILGVTLAAHGYNKFFGGGKIAGTAGWFDSMGMKPNGTVHAYLAASTELGAGALMVLGFLTPLAGAGFVGLMVVAAWTVNKSGGFFTMNHGWEYNLVLAASAVVVASLGPGKTSMDWLFGFDWAFDPNIGFFISAVGGAIAGIGLMVTCWRPPAKAE